MQAASRTECSCVCLCSRAPEAGGPECCLLAFATQSPDVVSCHFALLHYTVEAFFSILGEVIRAAPPQSGAVIDSPVSLGGTSATLQK